MSTLNLQVLCQFCFSHRNFGCFDLVYLIVSSTCVIFPIGITVICNIIYSWMGHIYAATQALRVFLYTTYFSVQKFLHPYTEIFACGHFCTQKFFNTGIFLHKRFCIEITLDTNEYIQKLAPIIIFTRNFLLNKNYLFLNIFTDIHFFFPPNM